MPHAQGLGSRWLGHVPGFRAAGFATVVCQSAKPTSIIKQGVKLVCRHIAMIPMMIGCSLSRACPRCGDCLFSTSDIRTQEDVYTRERREYSLQFQSSTSSNPVILNSTRQVSVCPHLWRLLCSARFCLGPRFGFRPDLMLDSPGA